MPAPCRISGRPDLPQNIGRAVEPPQEADAHNIGAARPAALAVWMRRSRLERRCPRVREVVAENRASTGNCARTLKGS